MQISIKGINHAIKTIEKYANMQDKLLELAYRLCEIGSTVCDSVYHTSVSVYVKRTETGAMVVCEGEDVLFIEFGTGQLAGAMAGYYDAVPPEVGEGTWSITHAQQYSTYGIWWFCGRPYRYTPPHPATYEAYREMVRAIPQVAREVFAR